MTKPSVKTFSAVVLCTLLLIWGCAQKGEPTKQNDEPPKKKAYNGELRVSADAGLETVLKLETDVFQYYYDSVTLKMNYTSEQEMFNVFKKHETDVLVMARELTQEETESLKQNDTIYTRQIKVAYDAVALVGNNKFDDTKLDVEFLKQCFAPSQNASKKLQMVFENKNSSCVNYVLGLLGYKEKVSSSVYALKNAQDVIDYVEQTENAIGFIPFSFLSDTDDERVKQIMKRIKILSLRTRNEKGEELKVSANQSDIADGIYPLIRTVNTVTKFSYSDNLEWLFVNFLYKEKGAKIFLKAGLIPAKMPEREINVNTEVVKGE